MKTQEQRKEEWWDWWNCPGNQLALIAAYAGRPSVLDHLTPIMSNAALDAMCFHAQRIDGEWQGLPKLEQRLRQREVEEYVRYLPEQSS